MRTFGRRCCVRRLLFSAHRVLERHIHPRLHDCALSGRTDGSKRWNLYCAFARIALLCNQPKPSAVRIPRRLFGEVPTSNHPITAIRDGAGCTLFRIPQLVVSEITRPDGVENILKRSLCSGIKVNRNKELSHLHPRAAMIYRFTVAPLSKDMRIDFAELVGELAPDRVMGKMPSRI